MSRFRKKNETHPKPAGVASTCREQENVAGSDHSTETDRVAEIAYHSSVAALAPVLEKIGM
jgi:hypothetical protein